MRGREGSGDEQAAATFRTLLTRAAVGLPVAGVCLSEEAAAELRERVQEADSAIRLLDSADALAEWQDALARVADREGVAPLLAGDAVRRLRDAGRLDAVEVERRMGLALGAATPSEVTAWLDGFLGDSGTLLIHDAPLLALLDDWLTALDAGAFQHALPLLRRVFARFGRPERRAIGESLRGGGLSGRVAELDINLERGMQVVPLLARMLGVGG